MSKFTKLVNSLVIATKTKIAALAKEELNNEEKKKQLDEHIKDIVEKTMNTLGCNLLLKFFIRKFVLPNISELTQVIYNLLKARVTGV